MIDNEQLNFTPLAVIYQMAASSARVHANMFAGSTHTHARARRLKSRGFVYARTDGGCVGFAQLIGNKPR